jgi:ABC-type multidrug transport system fused ATPase/permease subunit
LSKLINKDYLKDVIIEKILKGLKMKNFIANLYETYKPKNFLSKLIEQLTLKKVMFSITLISTMFAIHTYVVNLTTPHALLFSLMTFGLLFLVNSVLSLLVSMILDGVQKGIENKASFKLSNYLKENKDKYQDELVRLKLIGYQEVDKDYVLDDECLHHALSDIDNNDVSEYWINTISSTIIKNKNYYLFHYEKYLNLSKEQSVEKIKNHIANILYEENELQDKKQQLINQYVKKENNEKMFKKNKNLTMNL